MAVLTISFQVEFSLVERQLPIVSGEIGRKATITIWFDFPFNSFEAPKGHQ
jgi:hypothetical protein